MAEPDVNGAVATLEAPIDPNDQPEAEELEEAEPTMADLASEVASILRPAIMGELRDLLGNHYRGTQAQVDRGITAIIKEVGGTKAEQAEIKARIGALMNPEAAAELEKNEELTRLRRQATEPPTQEVVRQDVPAIEAEIAAAGGWAPWYALNIGADIDAHGRALGFTDDVIADGAAWTALMHQHGAPTQLSDLSPATVRRYKNDTYTAIKRASDARRVAARPRAVTDTANGGSPGRLTPEQALAKASRGEMTDAELEDFMKS